MSGPTPAPQPTPGATRVIRRRALPGHEAAYEAAVRGMFEQLAHRPGFVSGHIVPPERPGEQYHIVVHFASEEDMAAWDASPERRETLLRVDDHAADDPSWRELEGLEPWYVTPAQTGAARPPRAKMAVVTWLGIWPLVSVFFIFLTPIWTRLGLPVLLGIAINVALIVLCMTYVVAPLLTRAFRGWLYK